MLPSPAGAGTRGRRPAHRPLLAFRVGLIALGVGILSDVVSPADWTPVGLHDSPP